MALKENKKLENQQDSRKKALKKDKEESSEHETSEDQERGGVIPEDMDFKKFLGCGG